MEATGIYPVATKNSNWKFLVWFHDLSTFARPPSVISWFPHHLLETSIYRWLSHHFPGVFLRFPKAQLSVCSFSRCQLGAAQLQRSELNSCDLQEGHAPGAMVAILWKRHVGMAFMDFSGGACVYIGSNHGHYGIWEKNMKKQLIFQRIGEQSES